jgi:hypothetical protein
LVFAHDESSPSGTASIDHPRGQTATPIIDRAFIDYTQDEAFISDIVLRSLGRV